MNQAPPYTAAVIIVGNEILSAKFEDQNSVVLARVLRQAGVKLCEIRVVPDETEAVVGAIRDLLPRVETLFTSGGIGPTHDDLTLACVARALDRPIERNEEMETLLRNLLGVRLQPAHLRMADLPQGAVLLRAPGQVIPTLKVENIYVLPGVPEIFKEKVEEIVASLPGRPLTLYQIDTLMREGALAPLLEAVLRDHPGLEIGSYPKLGHEAAYKVRLTLESSDAELARAGFEALCAKIPSETIVELHRPDGS